MEELLPAKLSNTISSEKSKKIENIQQWVCYFNIYTVVMALTQPEKVVDLLAYSSLIVNASSSYKGTPGSTTTITFDTHKLPVVQWGLRFLR